MAPRHVSLILDGNDRAGKARGLNKFDAYRRGANNARYIAELLFKKRTPTVSAWACSGSNLGRDQEIVDILYKLLKVEMRKRLHRNEEVAFRLCGAWGEYTSNRSFHSMVETLEKKTAQYEHHLTVLFGYDGAWDIEQAAQSLHRQGTFPTLELIKQALWTAHLPDVNMIIRTGVEAIEGDYPHPHDSDAFLPLQRKSAFLYYTKTLWPDFTEEELDHALACYAAYKPRNGK